VTILSALLGILVFLAVISKKICVSGLRFYILMLETRRSRVGIFKHIFGRKNTFNAKSPIFEVLEPRVLLSADPLLSCLNTSIEANDIQPAIEYEYIQLQDTNHCTDVQIQAIEKITFVDTDAAKSALTPENLHNDNVFLLNTDDDEAKGQQSESAEITKNCNDSTIEINISYNTTKVIIPLITFHKGRMPISNNDADLRIQYATSIEPRAPPV